MRHTRMLILFVLVLVTVVAATTPALSQPTWISFKGATTQEKPSVVVQRSDETETVIEFQLRGMVADQVVENGETFQTLRFPYYYTSLEIGKPQLPVITEMIGIPGNADVRVSIVDSSSVILKGYNVYPFQTPLREEEKRLKFDIDRELYARDAFYPDRIVELSKPVIWRDLRAVNMALYPVQHNPATGELKVYQKLTVKVEYFGRSNINVLPPSGRPVSPDYEQMYRSLILNADFLRFPKGVESPPGTNAPNLDYDYLIITVDRFLDDVTPLKTWKDSRAIVTQIAKLSDIKGGGNPTAQEIKDYIAQEYNDHHIKWVLLVGDIAELPIYTWPGDILSDYWYALLTGDDFLPEVAVGRFSTVADAEVTLMVNKSIAFETNPSGNWIDNALLVAHKEGAPDKYQECKEDIRLATNTQSGTYRVKYPTFSTRYGAAGATNQNVVDEINDGRVVVNYRGHGSSTEWWSWNTSNQSFTTADAAALTNGSKTPVVFSIACQNNELDVAGDCLGEAFTQPDDAAVAFLGATRPSWTNANHTYDKQLFASVFDEGTKNIGNASNVAAVRIIQNHGQSGEENAEMYLWLGDPSLAIPVEDTHLAYRWLIVVDTTGSMSTSDRLDRAKSWASYQVTSILKDPNDEIALATFAGDSPFTLLMDWTRNEGALISRINALSPDGLTPLADACCLAADKLLADVPVREARRLVLLTDGGENYSDGDCAGPEDTTPNPPWCDNLNSWHCKVWTKLVNDVVVDIGYFGGIGPLKMGPEAIADASLVGFDEQFFQDVAGTTGGTYHDPVLLCGNGILDPGEQCDYGYPCSGMDNDGSIYHCEECQCVAVPALSPWGVAGLFLILLSTGLVFIVRRRRATSGV